MSMLDTTKIAIAFKKLVGKANTDVVNKEASNEALSSGISLCASTIFGETVPANPSNTALYQRTSDRVELVRLVLTPDPSANGFAFIASLPADYETNSSNPKKGTGAFKNGTVLASTAGALQLVPSLYDLKYEAKPYRGGSATKGSGSLVAPGDVVDWNLDYFNGVIYQENYPNTSPTNMTYLEAFIWIGNMVTDSIQDQQDNMSSLITKAVKTDINSGTTEIVDTVDISKFTTAKWIVSATKGTKNLSAEILGATNGLDVEYNQYADVRIGDPNPHFCEFEVDLSGGSLRLLATTNDTGVTVNITRINIV